MWSRDAVAHAMAMERVEVTPGHATLRMRVRPDMVNGHHICHGGLIFTLADTAFAYACNSYNLNTVASACHIDFLAPGRRATCSKSSRSSARHRVAPASTTSRSASSAAKDRRAVPRQERRIKGEVAPASLIRTEPAATPTHKPRGNTCQSSNPCPATSKPSRPPAATRSPALQLERLKWSVRHTYDNVAPTANASPGACIRTTSDAVDLSNFPS